MLLGRMTMTETTAKGRDLARGERLQVMLDREELAAVDDFRFASRMPSRAAAVRELLRRGLSGEGFALSPLAKSGEYGVLDSPPDDRGQHGVHLTGAQAPSK